MPWLCALWLIQVVWIVCRTGRSNRVFDPYGRSYAAANDKVMRIFCRTAGMDTAWFVNELDCVWPYLRWSRMISHTSRTGMVSLRYGCARAASSLTTPRTFLDSNDTNGDGHQYARPSVCLDNPFVWNLCHIDRIWNLLRSNEWANVFPNRTFDRIVFHKTCKRTIQPVRCAGKINLILSIFVSTIFIRSTHHFQMC